MTQEDYLVLSAEDMSKLSKRVREYQKKGYITAGGLVINTLSTDKHYFHQTIVKYSDNGDWIAG